MLEKATTTLKFGGGVLTNSTMSVLRSILDMMDTRLIASAEKDVEEKASVL